ncbi:MAG TPA: carbohydrate ABC transporter permease [Acidimicrobiales bacterium]|nr:carbohydrate ABC transporter permease [Acidimicrobiales bacterium]
MPADAGSPAPAEGTDPRAAAGVDVAERPDATAADVAAGAAIPATGVPGEVVLGAPDRGLTAATVGKSSTRRTAGLVGQYAVLVVLAALVLVPVVLTVIQALSPPFPYLDAGRPLHPVAVEWKDRGWLDGGAFSVVVRTLVVALALAWVQLRAGGGRLTDPAPLASPRRLLAVGAGVVAVALLAGQIWHASVDRSGATPLWWLLAIAVLAATQLVGFGLSRPRWRPLLLAALVGVGVTAGVVVAFGATVWNRGWDQGDIGPAMQRSFTITALITVAQVLTSILAAYAFAFLRFPFKTLVFALFMATLLLPLEVTLLANVQTIRELGWINSNAGLVLPFGATAFGTFLIRQGFRGVPPEVHDATRLDGYGHMGFLWRFAVPLTRPVIASFIVISALGAWNQYLWPQAIIDDDRQQTAQLALKNIVGTEVANSNIAIAAALVVALPVLLLLFGFSRQIIRGLTAGAVKG